MRKSPKTIVAPNSRNAVGIDFGAESAVFRMITALSQVSEAVPFPFGIHCLRISEVSLDDALVVLRVRGGHAYDVAIRVATVGHRQTQVSRSIRFDRNVPSGKRALVWLRSNDLGRAFSRRRIKAGEGEPILSRRLDARLRRNV